MGFDVSNIYSRVHDWAADKAAGVKIRADRMDAEFDAVATALTALGQNTLDPINPNVSVKGSAAAPGIPFFGDLDTGIASLGDDQLELVANGVVQLSVSTSGVDGVIGANTPAAGTFTTLDSTTSTTITNGFPVINLDNTLTASTHRRIKITHNSSGAALQFQTRASDDTLVSNDFQMFRDTSGATEHRFSIANVEKFSVDTNGVDINSGTIDGTTIGATSAAAGTFTAVTIGSGTAVHTGIAAGDVGSIAFAAPTTGTTYNFGDTIAGGSLNPAGASGSDSGTTLSGTWRCMGFSTANRATVFMRIS